MADEVTAVEHSYAGVGDEPGGARRLSDHLSERGINPAAFTAFPSGSGRAQFEFVPENASELREAAADAKVAFILWVRPGDFDAAAQALGIRVVDRPG